MLIFLVPIGINSLHDFLNHEHGVCSSKIESHIHEKDVDCQLHLLKQGDSFLAVNLIEQKIAEEHTSIVFEKYHYLKNHYQLSFALRGPPLTI